jgi:hypothetical protein
MHLVKRVARRYERLQAAGKSTRGVFRPLLAFEFVGPRDNVVFAG